MQDNKESVQAVGPSVPTQEAARPDDLKVAICSMIEPVLPSTARVIPPIDSANPEQLKPAMKGVDASSMKLAVCPSVVSSSLSVSRIPVELVWKNVTITAPGGKKILHDVSGMVKTGQFLAIIGASGEFI